ncbi:MAG TPA: protein-L-isoaspartate(D-aspartate) O-methyltransferase [Candidatus Acidoferrales bacterium]|nr:protein-L-isoaspartate(D-aspartate) O-methyltransferase [Candidatus Acidoferrales bacterium]
MEQAPDVSLFAAERRNMVERQVRGRGVSDARVLEAMGVVPRHLFVPPECVESAYSDHPIAIGNGQTISQPLMVALMTVGLELTGTERLLEVGAGSGYQAAILGRLAREVIALELDPGLAAAAARRLAGLGIANVQVLAGDASGGYPPKAPYDGIVVSAAASAVPQPLLEELAEGGRLLIPVGSEEDQELMRFRRTGTTFEREVLSRCRFVPLLGVYGRRRRNDVAEGGSR